MKQQLCRSRVGVIVSKLTSIFISVLIICAHTAYAQGLGRGARQADAPGMYSGFVTNYVATNSNWIINGTNFGMGQAMLLRNNLNGRLWTTYFCADGSQAYDASNAITANAMSMMDNIGLATNDSPLNWTIDAIGDFKGNGKDSVLITKTNGAQTLKKVLLFADNGTVTSSGAQWQNGSQWVIEGTGIFDTNSYAFKPSRKAKQIILRNNTNGRLWTTYIGTNDSQYYSTNDFTANTMSMMTNINLATNDAALNWTVDGIGDLTGSGKDNLLITKTSGGQTMKKVLFFTDNGIVKGTGAQWQNGSQWVVQGIGRFDTNAYSFKNSKAQQILLRNNTNGRLWTTYIDTNMTQYYNTNDFTANTMSMMTNIGLATNDSPLNWVVQAIGDVDGNGKDEVVLTKSSNGQLLKKVLFFTDNGIIRNAGTQWQNGTKWIIQGFGRSK